MWQDAFCIVGTGKSHCVFRGHCIQLADSAYAPRRWFGPVSLSVLAAFAHIGGQLLLARVWLIPHDGVFLLAPVFLAAALFFGIINGLIAARLLGETASDSVELQNG